MAKGLSQWGSSWRRKMTLGAANGGFGGFNFKLGHFDDVIDQLTISSMRVFLSKKGTNHCTVDLLFSS